MSSHGPAISDKRLVLAFYGVEMSPKASEGFFHTASQWFSELGYFPDKLGVGGEGHSGKVGDFRRLKSKLDKRGFSGVRDFSIYASKPNALIPGDEYFASANFAYPRRGDGRDGGYAVVAVPASSMTKEAWLPIADKIVRNVQP